MARKDFEGKIKKLKNLDRIKKMYRLFNKEDWGLCQDVAKVIFDYFNHKGKVYSCHGIYRSGSQGNHTVFVNRNNKVYDLIMEPKTMDFDKWQKKYNVDDKKNYTDQYKK